MWAEPDVGTAGTQEGAVRLAGGAAACLEARVALLAILVGHVFQALVDLVL